MSAVLKPDGARFADLTEADLAEVMAIERAIYAHPWTAGNFADSMRAGYHCVGLRNRGALEGYFVLIVAAGEAHLLNLSVAGALHRRGRGARMLAEILLRAAAGGARSIFLEVRPSNAGAQALYERHGFRRIAVRKGYYPGAGGREDALVYLREL